MNDLPETDSISELAAFWQAHDLTDFDDKLEEVPGPVFIRTRQIILPLSTVDATALHVIASQQRISEAELVSRWVHERLQTG
uniref:CopG antitoxin of type II toxin-antitoxin system n=1 Tax=Candidatus Kentrum sp. FM TaxID=2126340 RepID=A0A450S9R0_9GAMM|nr:MAG: hypothetical protein BECKFM1743A_GA0114220_1005510 [Candidatus Kentron sp. FM]VFJ48771.1 MAG: hypothetical protein BECKFM1743C_GA0114222_1006310 [Candidatus Kentron sp. FM]VFK09434.1 MAG: hypothetical protein BECKFM1743B_GA0114221_101053 [Candidatus Kentron sp. FM]